MSTTIDHDESVLNDLDEVLAHPDLATRLEEGERLRKVERNLETVTGEWLEFLLEQNAQGNLHTLPLIFRFGSLGQKLIAEAFAIGVAEGIKVAQTKGKLGGI